MKHSEMRESRPCQVALLVCVWGLVETGRMEEQGGAVQLSGGPGVALGGTSPPYQVGAWVAEKGVARSRLPYI